MFRHSHTEFADGNVACPYLPEEFLLDEGEDFPGASEWRDRWARASAETFSAPVLLRAPQGYQRPAAA